MADKKISALTGATTPLAGTEVLPIVQGGSTVKVPVADLTAGRAVAVGSLTSAGTVVNSYPTVGDASYYRIDNTDTGAASFAAFQMKTGFNSNIWQTFCRNNRWYIGVAGVADYIYVDSSANFNNVAGNYVPQTAGKGVNFTANTPAAGMTSQLLNWYEEGTFTPTVTSGSGTITTLGTVSGRYTRIGNKYFVNVSAAITTNGTGASYIIMGNLPTAGNGNQLIGSGNENAVTGKALTMSSITDSSIAVTFYDATYPGANGASLRVCLVYQA